MEPRVARVEQGTVEGFRYRTERAAERFVLEVVPPRRRAVPRLGLAVLWACAIALALTAVIRSRTSFIFLPILIFPAARFYRSLCGSVNRLRFTVDRSRARFDQGPLPRRRAPTFATVDVQGFRDLELDEPLGGWFGEPVRHHALRLVARDGSAERLPLILPSRAVAERIASLLDDGLAELREPSSYRG